MSAETTALLILVHGSPRPTANTDMFRVVEIIRQRNLFPIVEVGFLECNEPSIPEAIENCVSKGATHIRAVPYFLHTGTHVAIDLPALLEAGQRRHPQVTFLFGNFLGLSPILSDILTERIQTVCSEPFSQKGL